DDIQGLFVEDKRLNPLAGPYVRYQRGMHFGAVSEIVQGARLVEERRNHLNRLPYSHRFQIFNPVLERALKPYIEERSVSQLQMDMAERMILTGNLPSASLYLREALLSDVLVSFGVPTDRVWMDVPQSGGNQEIRVREVVAYILSSDEARRRVPDLEVIWPLLNHARRQYGHVTTASVSATNLKTASHEINRLTGLVKNVLRSEALAAIVADVSFDALAKQAVDHLAVRPRETRGKGQRPRRGARREGGRGGAGGQGGGRRGHGHGGGGGGGGGRGRGGDGPRGDGGGGRGRGRRPQGERPPRRSEGGERRNEGGGPPPAPTEDSTPRVEQVRGLGNLGLALRGALSDEPAQAPAAPKEGTPEAKAPAPASEPQPSTPAEAQPKTEPTPQAPPANEAKDAGFDVAGPAPSSDG
ncbi:MAG TPA: hypothetical protein ENK19_09830, partial [Acidobacteria bacterium]|nr:hypothetical protein [Acidobacteriota bacterium]